MHNYNHSIIVSFILYSFSDNADVECLNYCKKAIASCPTNPEAYQLMASYLLSRDKTEVGVT